MPISRLFSVLLVALFIAAPAKANTPISQMPAGEYVLDKTHASLVWKVSHLGLSDYTARFNDFDAVITLDPQNIENSTVRAVINPASVWTGYPNADEKDFDAKLAQGEDWFNAGAFPEIVFQSTGITVTGDDTADITGDLTMLGVTQPLTLNVVFNKAMAEQPFSGKPALGFSATASLNRSEWGFDTYVPNIGDAVEILLEVEFGKEDAVSPLNE